MHVLLVNPPSSGIFKTFGFQLPPLGLLYLAAYLEKESFQVTVKDFCVENKIDKHFDFSKYQVVGITTDTTRYPKALQIASMAKKYGCFVVMGGPHSHFVYGEVLNTGFIDCVVHGEGEIVLSALVRQLSKNDDIDHMHGISFKRHGKIIKTAPGITVPSKKP